MKNDFVFFENQTSATTGNALLNANGNLYIAIAGNFTGTVKADILNHSNNEV